MSYLTIELPPELARRLEHEAEKRGQAKEDFARTILEDRLQEMPEAASPEDRPEPKPIWRKFVEAGEMLSEEAIMRLPTDGARNIDHYLYGAAKESPSGPGVLPGRPGALRASPRQRLQPG